MRKRNRFAILGVALLCALTAAIYAVYRASQHVPEFYSKEISIPAETQEAASDLMLRQVTSLHSEAQHQGRWGQIITAEAINGWLAFDLPRNHPGLLPAGMHDPRVQIGPDGITLACQVERGGFRAVILLQVSAFVESDDVIGLEIHKARLGALPWSLDRVLKGISDAAQQANVRVRWRQSDGNPVALITVPPVGGERSKRIRVEAIKLEEGRLIIRGSTEIAPK
jgi:hypothetical protein